MAFQSEEQQHLYWRDNIKLLLSLLFVWFSVSFGAGIIFVDVLNQFHFFGFKLGFWFAQQGSIFVFVFLIFFYVWRMQKIDERYGVSEEDASTTPSEDSGEEV